LATWVTTLSVNALAIDPDFHQIMPEPERRKIRDWLLDQQYTTEHPYTLADPGGWAWTDLPGGVPDADDTAGALLALKALGLNDARTTKAAAMGIRRLLDLQNRDGGIPTFCRGWGNLPFDRSGADLTAHALRAWNAWEKVLQADQSNLIGPAARKAHVYLCNQSRRDGSWIPLWFGNQYTADDENPTYGTARVELVADAGARRDPDFFSLLACGSEWLVGHQGPDGAWGGGRTSPGSIEETALAIEALAITRAHIREMMIGGKVVSGRFDPAMIDSAITRGVDWLTEHTDRGTQFDPSPIGFYFAKLWYFEKLYPLIFTVAALNAVRNYTRSGSRSVVERTG
jgi:squalene-hopene/tetraprenyl-beta-curcumene cyclase